MLVTYRLSHIVNIHVLVENHDAATIFYPLLHLGGGAFGQFRKRNELALNGGQDARIELTGTEQMQFEWVNLGPVIQETVNELADLGVRYATTTASHFWL